MTGYLVRLAALALVLGSAAAAPVASAGSISLPGNGRIEVPVRSLVDLRFKDVVRQSLDLSCGAAAMATLLNHYYGEPLSEQDLIQIMLATGDPDKIAGSGFSMLEMKRAGEARGYVANGYKVEDVRQLYELEVPVITLINTRGYGHFVVIRGASQGRVHIADPAFGNASKPIEQFAAEWNNVILAVLSPNRPGDQAFMTDATVKAPMHEVIVLIDRVLQSIRPGAGEF